MASTYSNLKIELIATGEQAGTWGSTTNTNLGTALEEAIVGRATANYSSDGDLTVTLTNTNASQVARHYILNVTSGVALTATRNLVVPTIDKPYIVENNTTGGQNIVVKTVAGSGVTIPNGKKAMVYANSTNVVRAFDSVGDLAFVGAAKITGDFSNATFSNRVAFQSSTTNGNTSLTVLPNGTATGSAVQVYNDADPTNAELFSIQISSTLATLASDLRGTGTYVPMALATGGSARVYIDTSGNVGIGTASPTAPLDVNGGVTISAASARVKGDFSNATFSNRVAFQSSTTNGDTAVGALPNGTATGSAFQAYNNSNPTDAGLVSIQASNTLATLASDKRGAGSYLPLALATGGSARVYVDTSGNVGIATASPTAPLDVNGNVAISATGARVRGDFSNATIANRVAFQTSTTNGDTVVGALPNGTATGSALQAYNNSTPTNAGLVSIQATNTLATLASDIRGSGTYLPLALATGGSARVYIDTSGNVGVATASPAALFDVNGTLKAITGDITTVNATTGNITTVSSTTVGATTGNITTVNATTVNATTVLATSGKVPPRVSSAGSASSLTPNTDNFDQYQYTALAAGLTINADTGSPVDGQKLVFRFKDNGTARALTWTTGVSKGYRAIGVTLPTTTIVNKTMYIGCIYNATDARWDVVAYAQEA